MRSIIKTSIIVTALLSASINAIAEENVKLIVTKKDGTSTTAYSNDGMSQVSKSKAKTTSESLSVPESEVSRKMSELYEDKNVIAVERDVTIYQIETSSVTYPYSISQQSVSTDNRPNDPAFQYQNYFLERSQSNLAASNILGAWALGEQKIRPKIAVMDGGFLEEGRFADVNPAYNYSFVDSAESNVGDPAWSSVEELDCEDGHGIGVYGVVGAISNNGEHVAGIVDADMYMLQVMRCGSGSLFQAANALRWSAGGEVEGVPTLSEPVDIATFSLGGRTARCPTYMQSAIDFAVSRGVKVFMAAGNDNDTVTGFAPANCNNVIVTTALDNETGDKASFGNYDEKVDVVTQGTRVGGLSSLDGGIGLWSGTSFAGPISAGIYGLALSYAPTVGDDVLEMLMMQTLSPLENAPSCDSVGCGKGLINAAAFVNAAIRYEEGSFAQVKSALSETALCDSTPYLMVSGLKARLCSAYSVSIDADMFTSDEGDVVIYKLYQWPAGESLNREVTAPLFEGIETDFLINDIDVNKLTGIVRCVNGNCADSIVLPVSLTDTGRPDACDA